MPFDVPHPVLLTLWLLWIAQAAWSAYNVRKFHRRAHRVVRRRARAIDAGRLYQPPVAIIIPVKGTAEHFADHVRALAQQRYPRYRLIFTVESEHDPAYPALQEIRREIAREIAIVVAGRADRGGQKGP